MAENDYSREDLDAMSIEQLRTVAKRKPSQPRVVDRRPDLARGTIRSGGYGQGSNADPAIQSKIREATAGTRLRENALGDPGSDERRRTAQEQLDAVEPNAYAGMNRAARARGYRNRGGGPPTSTDPRQEAQRIRNEQAKRRIAARRGGSAVISGRGKPARGEYDPATADPIDLNMTPDQIDPSAFTEGQRYSFQDEDGPHEMVFADGMMMPVPQPPKSLDQMREERLQQEANNTQTRLAISVNKFVQEMADSGVQASASEIRQRTRMDEQRLAIKDKISAASQELSDFQAMLLDAMAGDEDPNSQYDQDDIQMIHRFMNPVMARYELLLKQREDLEVMRQEQKQLLMERAGESLLGDAWRARGSTDPQATPPSTAAPTPGSAGASAPASSPSAAPAGAAGTPVGSGATAQLPKLDEHIQSTGWSQVADSQGIRLMNNGIEYEVHMQEGKPYPKISDDPAVAREQAENLPIGSLVFFKGRLRPRK